MESVSRYSEVIERADKVQEEVVEYLKEQEENREINEKLRNIALNYRLMKEDELQKEVEKLKADIKNLKQIVDELGYIVMNNISTNEDTETLIRKSQNTLKILDKFCQM